MKVLFKYVNFIALAEVDDSGKVFVSYFKDDHGVFLQVDGSSSFCISRNILDNLVYKVDEWCTLHGYILYSY